MAEQGPGRADRPRRVAILGWARLSAQGRMGSGYNLNASDLARGLAARGHHVLALCSGQSYRWGLFGPGRVRIREVETWEGVRCCEVVNSPNASPGACNFENMASEIASPSASSSIVRFLLDEKIDVAHVHSLEGYGLDLIGAMEAAGIRVVVTMHNYWYVCPQVDLFERESRVCLDYEGGARCVGCVSPPHGLGIERYRRARAIGQTLEGVLGVFWADVARKGVYGVKALMREALRGRLPSRNAPEAPSPDIPASELWAERTGAGGAPKPHEPASIPVEAIDANERMLGLEPHDGHDADRHLKVLNNGPPHAVLYGRRRIAGVNSLRKASLVTAPSDFLRRVHVAMGVPEGLTRWVRLGMPHFDLLNARARSTELYAREGWRPSSDRPLRLAFFGTTRANKGLEVFVRAIEGMAPEVRRRCRFIIRASGDDLSVRRRLAGVPEASVWGGYDLLQLVSSIEDYDVGVLAHRWMENSPLVMLEHLHAGKPVITPRLGGVVDWIRDGVNGLFFRGGDPDGLASCIARIVRGDVLIPSMREIHETTVLPSYLDHVLEVEGIYEEVLNASSSPGAG